MPWCAGDDGEGKEETKGEEGDELVAKTTELEKELEFILSLGAHRLRIEPADFEKDQVGWVPPLPRGEPRGAGMGPCMQPAPRPLV